MIRALQSLWRRCTASGRHKLLVESSYVIGELIGRGRLGLVHKCTHRKTGKEFACKEMPANDNAFNEMVTLQKLFHPGILKVRTCYWSEWLGGDNWSRNGYMISDLCDGGDLQRFIDQHGHGIQSETKSARIIESLVRALQYCHSKKIIHRDVKPSSIFISNGADPSSCRFILGNFDLSICIENQDGAVHDNVGKLGYSAPEMLIGNEYSYEVDIWSAGVVLFVLLCGRTPFSSENAMMMYEEIQNTELDFSSGEWSSISDSAKDLVRGMLQKDCTQRLSCDQILSHPWIMGNAQMTMASTATNTDIASTSGVDATVASTATNTEIASTSGVDATVASTATNTEIASTSGVDATVASNATNTEIVSTSGVDAGHQ